MTTTPSKPELTLEEIADWLRSAACPECDGTGWKKVYSKDDPKVFELWRCSHCKWTGQLRKNETLRATNAALRKALELTFEFLDELKGEMHNAGIDGLKHFEAPLGGTLFNKMLDEATNVARAALAKREG